MYLARLFPCFFFSVRDDARLSEERVRSFRYRLDERQPRRSVSPRVTIHALYRIRWKRDRRSSRITRSRVSQERQFLRKPTERRAKKQVNYAKYDEFLGNRKLNGHFRMLRVAACKTRDCSTHAWKRAS